MDYRKRITLLLGFIFLAALPIFLQWIVQYEFKRYSSGVEMVFGTEDSDYLQLMNNREFIDEEYLTSFSVEMKGTYKGNQLLIINKDKNYKKFYPYSIKEGRDLAEGEQGILISEQFSKRIFSDTNAIGRTIEISGENFLITGIYKPNILENIYNLNTERVYAYSRVLLEQDNDKYYKVLFSGKDGISGLFFKEKLREYISEGIPYTYIEESYMNDYSDYSTIISQFFRGSVFIISLLGFACITIIIYRKLKDHIKQYGVQLDSYYTKEIIYKNIDIILMEAIKMVLLIFLGIIILRFVINFKFDIPGRVLPPDYIFDFQFYSDLIANKNYSEGIYTQLYRRLLRIQSVSLLATGIFSLLLCIFILEIKKETSKCGYSDY